MKPPQARPPRLYTHDALHVIAGGRSLVYFGGCDYYRLSWHPAVRRALRRGLRTWGLNVAASRKTTGNHPGYEMLEKTLARFFKVPAAVLLSSGYMTSLAAAQALAGQFTHVLLDEQAHLCLQDAAQFLHAPILQFRHRDPVHLSRQLRQCGLSATPLLMTDGLFAHDGSVAPLRDYLDRLPQRGRLLVDDAHAAGVMGRYGRGTVEWAGLNRSRVIQTVTLSKAFGVYGGAILGPVRLCDTIRQRSHLFTGNTPLPLPLVEASLTALDLYRRNPKWRRDLQERIRHVKQALSHFPHPSAHTPGPIVCWPVRHARHRRILADKLRAAGLYPSFLQYPGGPKDGYFRFAISSAHPFSMLDRLIKVLQKDATGRQE